MIALLNKSDVYLRLLRICDTYQNIRIYYECEGRIEKSVQRINAWHHEACLVMMSQTVIHRDRFFYPTFTRIMDYFSCSSLFSFIYIFNLK